MKLTEISQYEAQPGHMIEWGMHPDTIAAAAQAAPDPRPASYMQEAHIKMAAFLQGIDVEAPTWLGTGFDIPGALDLEAMEATLLQWITRHETLRSGLRLTGQDLERFTLDAEAISLERTVVDDFAHGADVTRFLENRFDETASPLTWPPYHVVTVGREDAFTIYLAFDHSNVDGYSIALIAQEIHELYAAALAGRPAALGAVGSYIDFAATERAAADDIDADNEAVVRWGEFVETCAGELPRFPLDLGIAPGEFPRQTGGCEWLLDPADAEAFNIACRSAGGNFAAGVLAAASIVAYEQADQPVYRTVLPFHTRSDAQWAASLGWYVGLAPLEVATAQAQDFGEVIRMARQATKVAKPIAQVPFARVCSVLDTVLRPTSVISYIDGRMVPGAANWTDWNAHAFGRVVYGDEVYLWINRTNEGVYLTCRYPDTAVACANVPSFIENLRNVLVCVGRSGGYPIVGRVSKERVPA
jgi:hypothetical protein